jgi:hypothetical protein
MVGLATKNGISSAEKTVYEFLVNSKTTELLLPGCCPQGGAEKGGSKLE